LNYRLIYSKKAKSQLSRLPIEFVDIVQSEMDRLGESPASVSVPIASPPYAPFGQLFHFTIEYLDQSWFFTAFFNYSQDESSPGITSITWREIDTE